jgi:hypothetical protein
MRNISLHRSAYVVFGKSSTCCPERRARNLRIAACKEGREFVDEAGADEVGTGVAELEDGFGELPFCKAEELAPGRKVLRARSNALFDSGLGDGVGTLPGFKVDCCEKPVDARLLRCDKGGVAMSLRVGEKQ